MCVLCHVPNTLISYPKHRNPIAHKVTLTIKMPSGVSWELIDKDTLESIFYSYLYLYLLPHFYLSLHTQLSHKPYITNTHLHSLHEKAKLFCSCR